MGAVSIGNILKTKKESSPKEYALLSQIYEKYQKKEPVPTIILSEESELRSTISNNYEFTKKWDGFHLWLGKDRYSNGINDHLNLCWNTQPEISLDLFDIKGQFKTGPPQA